MMNQALDDHGYIQARLLDEVSEHMRQGADHYGPNNHNELGLKGQYADMHRKMQPLKRYMWDGQALSLAKESPRQICMDLIGHCLLTIAMIDREMPLMKEREPITKPIITFSGDRDKAAKQIENLKAAGWYEDNGVWHGPAR